MKRLIIYADTSVFGGCFDKEFELASRTLFEDIRHGRFILAVSDTTIRELDQAPEKVRGLLAEIPRAFIYDIFINDEIIALREAYIKAGIVKPASRLDAEHIASASVSDVDMIVSWNFKHIVHFEKIRGYHAVNIMKGYHPVPIFSPREVIEL